MFVFFSQWSCAWMQSGMFVKGMSFLLFDYFRQSSSVFFGVRVLALTLQRTSNGILPGQELWDCDPGWGDEVVYERTVLMCRGKSWRSLLQIITGKDRWKIFHFLINKSVVSNVTCKASKDTKASFMCSSIAC